MVWLTTSLCIINCFITIQLFLLFGVVGSTSMKMILQSLFLFLAKAFLFVTGAHILTKNMQTETEKKTMCRNDTQIYAHILKRFYISPRPMNFNIDLLLIYFNLLHCWCKNAAPALRLGSGFLFWMSASHFGTLLPNAIKLTSVPRSQTLKIS